MEAAFWLHEEVVEFSFVRRLILVIQSSNVYSILALIS